MSSARGMEEDAPRMYVMMNANPIFSFKEIGAYAFTYFQGDHDDHVEQECVKAECEKENLFCHNEKKKLQTFMKNNLESLCTLYFFPTLPTGQRGQIHCQRRWKTFIP